MGEAFKGFWSTGVVGGNSHDMLALGNEGKGRVNPMFAISSSPTKEFAVHYASDPLLGFHLAEAFDDGTKEAGTVGRVVQLAKSQFRDWCTSFANCLGNGRL